MLRSIFRNKWFYIYENHGHLTISTSHHDASLPTIIMSQGGSAWLVCQRSFIVPCPTSLTSNLYSLKEQAKKETIGNENGGDRRWSPPKSMQFTPRGYYAYFVDRRWVHTRATGCPTHHFHQQFSSTGDFWVVTLSCADSRIPIELDASSNGKSCFIFSIKRSKREL